MSHRGLAAASAAPTRLRNYLWLLVAITGTLLVYAALTWLCWLPAWIQTPRVSVSNITNRTFSGASLLALFGLTLYTLYVLGALILWSAEPRPEHRWLIWAGALAASLLLLWCYPITSTDIFDYFFRSRMTLTYGANPYLALPNQYKTDPFIRHIGWPNAPSAYGPLWEHLSASLVRLGNGSLIVAVLLYKLLALFTYLLSGLLIGRLAEDQRLQTLSLYLWLLSPLTLWELVAVGHNDGLMVLALLLAIGAARLQRHWIAVLALTAGVLIKFLPAIFLPLVVIHWMRAQPSWIRRLSVAALSLALFITSAAGLYAGFWHLPPDFARLDIGGKLDALWDGRTTTLHNLAVREGFLNAAPLAVLSYLLQTPRSLALINTMFQSLALPLADTNDVRSALSTFGNVLLVVGLAWQCWHVWFRARPLQHAFLGLLLWYVLASSQWFQPWYIVWLLAIFAIIPTRTGFWWLTGWAMMAQSSYLLQYVVLPSLKLGGQTLEAQALYLLLIYTLPLVVWLLTRYGPLRSHAAASEPSRTSPRPLPH